MKKLHRRWGDRLEFVDVITRQAHPGPDVPAYGSFREKLNDARKYRDEEDIPWTVLVDDLEGTTHQVYGSLADPTYLIDRDGRVSFYNMWTHAPTLHEALEALIGQGGRGVINGGVDNIPHMLQSMTTGWRGLRRGLPQSFIDMETAAPGMGTGMWLGYHLRSVLAPVTQRETPLPPAAKLGLAALGAGLLIVAGRRFASTAGD